MGARTTSSLITISVIIFAFSSFRSSEACGISVYWGQYTGEGSLRDTCATGYYKWVNLAYLITFGSGQDPVLNLAGHCTPPNCQAVGDDIRYCQSLGIKVLLSLGGAGGNYTLSSAEDAGEVAQYLWDTFLAGGDPKGIFGNTALDGIDFQIVAPGSQNYWDDLAKAIAAFSTSERKIYLAAGPPCEGPFPRSAIDTGVFDYVWVGFYQNSQCDYTGGASSVLKSWDSWSSSLPTGNQLFMGLPPSKNAVGSGYIPPQNLIDEILPVIKKYPNYGGINIFTRNFDKNYSQTIYPYVCDGEDPPQCLCPCPCVPETPAGGRIKMVGRY